MARRLKTIARVINDLPLGYQAEVVKGYCNTDRKIRGRRIRIPGKGRHGNRLIVRDRTGLVILDHNAADPYRQNYEVENWLEFVREIISRCPEPRKTCPKCKVRLKLAIGHRGFEQCPKCHRFYIVEEKHV